MRSDSTTHDHPVARKARFRKIRKLLVLLRRRRWRNGLRHNVAAAVEHRNVPFPHNYSTVIDVGAHNGQFALLAKELFPNAQLLCVEPQAESVNRIQKVFSHDDSVKILKFAASETSGRRVLHVSRESDSSSLLPIKKRYVDSFPGTDESHVETIEARRLDEMVPSISRPALLKIDVQGGEMEVIRGAGSLVESIDAAFVECSFVELYEGQPLADEIITVLADCGLRLRGVFSVVRNEVGDCIQADMLFVRSES